jgi:hypothetical protein
MTAMAPGSQRKCRLPCFEILPSLSLPPVECCLGTKPIHAARLRPAEQKKFSALLKMLRAGLT